MTQSGSTSPDDVARIVAGLAMVLSLSLLLSAYIMKRVADRGYLLGNIAYPMGKDALDPELNRKARERDLEVGRRMAARMWSLWPVYVLVCVAGFITLIWVAATS